MAKINCRKSSVRKPWIPSMAKNNNAERERSRVRSLRNAFQTLQSCLPSVPPDTKLSKLDILILATNYIEILTKTLDNNMDIQIPNASQPNYFESTMISRPITNITKVYRPIKKWPMRSRLYSMVHCSDERLNDEIDYQQKIQQQQQGHQYPFYYNQQQFELDF